MTRFLTITECYRLRDLKLLPSQAVPDGKLIFGRGHKTVGYGTTEKLGLIPNGADNVMLSVADHQRLQDVLARKPSTILAAG